MSPDKKLFYKNISKSFLSKIIFLISKIIPIRIKNIIYHFITKVIFVYGELKRQNIGKRNYSDKFKHWVEIFPKKPGHWTGPPTLIGSNIIDVRDIFLDIEEDKEHYAFFSK